ncbi:MAG: OPT/YSL family transporter [Planctomycetota bacterium]|nr:OPT/YSL family transporter [Planctomycetota bacterium]
MSDKTPPPTDGFEALADLVPAPQQEVELPLAGFTGTPDEIERQWFENVYRGRGDSMAQLTWRAVLMGGLLGGVLSLTNLYIGLKAGWGFGVAITACILSYAIWTALYKLGLARSQMSILENNCMQSTASAAGYSTGGTLVSAFAAYLLLGNEPLPLPLMLGWVFFLAVLGVTMAIPMKRQMINIEQLRFPSGIAAAETLRALHSHGEKGLRSARALGLAGLLAAINQFWAEGLKLISVRWEPYSLSALVERGNEAVLGKAWMGRTVQFMWDPIFLAAGVLTGLRVSASMLLGGTLCWAVFVPILQHQGIIAGSGFREVVQWTLWGGVSCMVTSGLLSFGLQWRSMFRAFRSLGAMFSRAEGRTQSDVDRLEAPTSWFLIGQLVAFVGLAWLAHMTFEMPVWQSAVAVLLSFFLALVACRVTGETDTTPIGAMGKVTQLIFGGLSPGNTNVNLMSANITAGAATSAADLLTDLKSGYLLGANPRQQFLAQFAGIFVGTLVTVLSFQVLVPSAAVLGTDQFPAPAAQTWRAVAVALSQGLGSLGSVKVWSIVIGGLLGILLPVLAKLFPRYEKWIPSASGVGLSWTFHWYYSLLFFLGAVIGYAFERQAPKQSEAYTFPVASGIIAGGSLMGVILILWENGPQLIRQFFASTS